MPQNSIKHLQIGLCILLQRTGMFQNYCCQSEKNVRTKVLEMRFALIKASLVDITFIEITKSGKSKDI